MVILVKVGTITNILLERETTLHIGFVSLLKNEVTSTSWFITNLPSLAAHCKTTRTKDGVEEKPCEKENTGTYII